MHKFIPRPLVLAVATVCVAMNAHAQTVSGSTDDADKASTQPTVAPPSSSQSGFLGGMFSAPGTTGSASQLAATPSYELSGIGRRDTTQETTILTAPTNGLPIRFSNGIFLYMDALAGYGHNSNVTGVPVGKISSDLYSIQPNLVAELKHNGDRYTLRYHSDFTGYTESAADNYQHHNLNLSGDNYFTVRSRLGWDVGYIDSSDARGSTDSGATATPNRWTAPTAHAVYIYGAKDAAGRVEAESSFMSKRYQNNRASTLQLDNDATSVAGRFFYRVMPRTSALLELRNTHYSYANNSSYTNNDTRALVGVTWDATAKTQGTVKVGAGVKSFSDSATYGTGHASSWEVAIRWSPLTYSSFDVLSNRTMDDSTGVGNYLVNTGSTLVWNHQWRTYLTSRATLGTLHTNYKGATRKDDTTNAGFGLFYIVTSNWRVGAEWTYGHRRSNISGFEYNRNTAFLSLQGTL